MKILTFQHLSVEHPGTFRDFWGKRGWGHHVVELDEGHEIPDLEQFDLLVVMGGPQDVWQEDLYPWLKAEKAAIRRWVRDLNKPYLGICLGHQLLAAALGGRVSLMKEPEVGIVDVELTSNGLRDPLFLGFSRTVQTFQWHGAEIVDLPDGAVILASNSGCATQAIRYGKHAYGMQFHVEITPATVREWEEVPAYKASLQRSLGLAKAEEFKNSVKPHLASFKSAAQQINDNFLTIIAKQFVARAS